ncbi:alpha/beta fold hydrolase [Agromyces archimandritae]|uniref:Alpha/beta fold hydrolase n=1 Tax=Agromyces archimandritae TaxID=2781962 RepID=A0A975FLS2_9MICO|nr:alpha/beta hydrolase [Agromyces archimandritae]QTX03316.1 alpha/beta fold hydrolase [Agromyces archimandritae]
MSDEAYLARITVDTDELRGRAQLLGLLDRAIVAWRSRCTAEYAVPGLRAGGADELGRAAIALDRLAERTDAVRAGLHAAADGYERAERQAGLMNALLQTMWWQAGHAAGPAVFGTIAFLATLSPIGLAVVAGTVAQQAALGLTAGALLGYLLSSAGVIEGEPGPDALLRQVISQPAFAAWLRTAVDSVDDFGAGLVGLPPSFGLIDADESTAALIVGIAAIGAAFGGRPLQETPVKVKQVSPEYESPAALAAGGEAARAEREDLPEELTESRVPPNGEVDAPDDLNELMRRIPDSGPGEPQVRVEQYDGGWVVYVSGTVDWSLEPGTQSSDATSAVGAVANEAMLAGRTAAAERAAEEALAAAGFKPGDPIVTVGHSLGGAVAARIAENHPDEVKAVFTAGAPVAKIPVPDGVPVVSLEHPEDPVPATAGSGAPNDSQVVLGRSVLDGAATTDVIPAHGMIHYRGTAGFVDDDPALEPTEALDALAGITGGGGGQATRWLAERVPPEPRPAEPAPPAVTSTGGR